MKWEVLRSILHDRKVTHATNSEFIYLYQRALLLSLLESGQLTECQYHYAEQKLQKQQDNTCLNNLSVNRRAVRKQND